MLLKVVLGITAAVALAWPGTVSACSHVGKSMTSKTNCRRCVTGGYTPINDGTECSYQFSTRYLFCDCTSCTICRATVYMVNASLLNFSGTCSNGNCANAVITESNYALMYEKYNSSCTEDGCNGATG